MQGIYTYIPETNYVPREYSVAAIPGAHPSSCATSTISLSRVYSDRGVALTTDVKERVKLYH